MLPGLVSGEPEDHVFEDQPGLLTGKLTKITSFDMYINQL